MKTKPLLPSLFGTLAALLACCQPLNAQNGPDIVWQTNAMTAPVTSIALSPDGSLLASAEESDGRIGRVRLWRVDTGELVRTLTRSHEDFLSVAFSPDGTLLATGGGGGAQDEAKLRIWRSSDGTLMRSAGCCGSDWIRAVAFSSDGRWLAVGRDGGHLQILGVVDGADGGGTEEPAHRGIRSIAFSPTMQILATGGGEGSAKLWDYTDGLSDETLLRTFSDHTDSVNSVEFRALGSELATGSADSTVIIRRVTDGFPQHTLIDSNGVTAMAVAPHSQTLLTASSNIKFWRITDGSLLQTFDRDVDNVTSLAISRDGHLFAYGRSDGTVVVAFMPVWINDVSLTGNKITIQWQGGSGFYRVQARPHLDKGDWHYLGPPTTSTMFTHSAQSHLFYRVVSLPKP